MNKAKFWQNSPQFSMDPRISGVANVSSAYINNCVLLMKRFSRSRGTVGIYGIVFGSFNIHFRHLQSFWHRCRHFEFNFRSFEIGIILDIGFGSFDIINCQICSYIVILMLFLTAKILVDSSTYYVVSLHVFILFF